MRPVLPMVMLLALPAPAMAGGAQSPDGLDGFVTADRLPVPAQPVLAAGAAVWAGSCQNCHGGSKLTGAPKITSETAWAPRIAKGMETLADHAINGFTGPKYTRMPARGGDDGLSDAQVRAAVAFMVWASGGADTARAYAETQAEME